MVAKGFALPGGSGIGRACARVSEPICHDGDGVVRLLKLADHWLQIRLINIYKILIILIFMCSSKRWLLPDALG